jgi:poly-gamma-glutamate biosynthesis protein PgsC/CapC
MDVATLAIAIGLIVSLLFTEVFGLSGGGMIVPGYLALYADKPYSILMTLLAAFITFGIVRAITKVAIVYGRRRIVLMVLFGFLVGSAMRAAAGAFTNPAIGQSLPPATNCFCVIGFIIPGLIALWMDRQGTVETLGPLMTSTVIVRLVLILIGIEVAI